MKLWATTILFMYTILCRTLYVEYKEIRKEVNTQTKEHRKNLTSILDYALTRKSQPDHIEKFLVESEVPALARYARTLEQLKKLPAASAGCIIHPQWIIGAEHVLKDAVNTGIPLLAVIGPNSTPIGVGIVKEIFVCPDNSDLALARIEPTTTKTVEILKGNLKANMDYYLFSDTAHTEGLKNESVGDFPFYAHAIPIKGADFNNMKVEFEFVENEPFEIRTHGGDSSGPVFVRVNYTGNPFDDFRIAGVAGNVQGSKFIAYMLTNTKISDWIKQIIATKTLRHNSA